MKTNANKNKTKLKQKIIQNQNEIGTDAASVGAAASVAALRDTIERLVKPGAAVEAAAPIEAAAAAKQKH